MTTEDAREVCREPRISYAALETERSTEVESVERLEEEGIGFGLSGTEVQSVARRQLIASIIVAIVIAAAAGLIALRPAYHDAASVGPHRFAGAQQPSFATPPAQRVAGLRRHGIELP